jgi:ATP-dependent DNA ligase
LRARVAAPELDLAPAKVPPAGPGWIHEIKHDGFRIIARRDATGVRLITRNGYDLADRFPLAAAAVAALPARSCVVDGEAIAVDDNGLSVFDLIRYRPQDAGVELHECRAWTVSRSASRSSALGAKGQVTWVADCQW